MALIRPTRLNALKRGSGPTTVTGCTEIRFNVQRQVAFGYSGSDWTYSSADVTGYSVNGTCMFQDITQAETLEDVAPEALIAEYLQSGSATVRKRTFDKMKWGPIRDLQAQEGGSSGTLPRYAIDFTGLFDSADDTFDDFTAVADVS
jgi:hypothetical protein